MKKLIKAEKDSNAILTAELSSRLDKLCEMYDLDWWKGAQYLDEDSFYDAFQSEHQYFQQLDNLVDQIKNEFESWFLKNYGYADWYYVPEHIIDIIEDIEDSYGLY